METMNTKYFCRIVDAMIGFNSKRPLNSTPLCLELPETSITAVLGCNGSGKSTLLRAILGEDVLLSGSVYFRDNFTPMDQWPLSELSKTVAYLPQEHAYSAGMRVNDLFNLTAPNASLSELRELLEKMSLEPLRDSQLGKISTGERQRVFLARAFLQKPKMLLLDEPTNHLDPKGREQFWTALLHENKNSCMQTILSTHDLQFVKMHCEWVIAMKNGAVLYSGPASDFWSHPSYANIYA